MLRAATRLALPGSATPPYQRVGNVLKRRADDSCGPIARRSMHDGNNQLRVSGSVAVAKHAVDFIARQFETAFDSIAIPTLILSSQRSDGPPPRG